jgi:hypothetical protein
MKTKIKEEVIGDEKTKVKSKIKAKAKARIKTITKRKTRTKTKASITANEKCLAHLKEYMEFLSQTRTKFFGNARHVRKVVEEAIKNQHLRLAKINPENRDTKMIHVLQYEDVEEFKINYNALPENKSIGFKQNNS